MAKLPQSANEDPFHGNPPSELLRAALGAGTGAAHSSRPHWDPPAPEELALLMPAYSISRLIGRGGMGAVYHGLQRSLNREVAIKLLPPELGAEPEFEARFKREAMALARLNHPNIVQIHDYGQTIGDHHYIVMEYVDGTDLHQLIRSGSLDVTSALNAVTQICGALEYAHGEGFVHRDIKPANIFINRKGVLKIGDFGLAKLAGTGTLGEGDPAPLTQSDMVMGTLHYSAPEQLGGDPFVDHRADIYSLGVMFYEMLTGTVPRGNFRAPSERIGAIDVRIDGIVFKAMEQDPDDRYQSAADLGSEVERIRSGSMGDTGPGPSAGAGPPPAASRARWRSITVGVAGMAVVATLLVLLKRPQAESVKLSVSLPQSPAEVQEPPIPSAASRSIQPLRDALAECRDQDRKWRERIGGTKLPSFELFFLRDQDPRSLGASFAGLEALSQKDRWTALDQSAARSFAYQFAKSAQDLTDNLNLLEIRSRTGNPDQDREFTGELVRSGVTERIKAAVTEVAIEVPFAESTPDQAIEDPAKATPSIPFRNSLGMKFVPVAGTQVLFCVHETRFSDYERFALDQPGLNQRWRSQTEDGFVITERSGDHPVTWVIWSEAKAFCDWLGKKEGRNYRLPTDEEWSFAAGMIRPFPGGPSVIGTRYPWGDAWPPPAGAGNYSDQSRKRHAPATYAANYLEGYDDGYPTTAPVMSFPANEFGLHDLGGNVWEWVEDQATDHPAARLRRGGSWRIALEPDLRSSYRLSNEPSQRDPIHGFRLVLVPETRE